MISQLLCALVDSDPLYVAKRTADTRRYIMTAWCKTHDEPLDENAVALFLSPGDSPSWQTAFGTG